MSEKEFSGYLGDALEAVKRVEVEVGGLLRITKNGEVYEGFLISRFKCGDDGACCD